MADSIREQLLVAALAKLTGAGKPVGLNVHRQRTLPLEDDQLPASVLYLMQEELPAERQQRPVRQLARRQALLAIEHRAEAADGTTDQALDPLTTWGVQALLADATLGGLAVTVVELGTKWSASDDDATRGAATQLFQIDYITAVADPSARR